ncbi:lactate utilization protein C [Kocuria coralli]|uniref:Lactate utilization protein C n=1 Tax=Kocuria coralli TaxID=1461025 RepID=A0A5J5KXE4_9MICC|nr:LUD domain-containing protein [Kocuria coralli]KAA9393960.1 lactate utilization protein C [Kocuria coralli]
MSENVTRPTDREQDAKAAILSRIRYALRDEPAAPEVPRDYRRASSLDHAEVVDMLEDRLVDYKANVYRETGESLPQRVGQLLGEAVTIVPEGLDESWIPDSVRTVRDRGDDGGPLTARELDGLGAVVTSSTVSCAETGTIFLNSHPDEGRRALSLVPDHHVCVVPLDSVVELIPEAFERVSHDRPITMISGPSATSDIELERVEGVHGPRTLDVILLG